MNTDLDEIVSKMIISPSGWRGVFAKSGEEESAAPEISREHRIIAYLAARVFSDYLEFKIDYTKELKFGNGSWELYKNWNLAVPPGRS